MSGFFRNVFENMLDSEAVQFTTFILVSVLGATAVGGAFILAGYYGISRPSCYASWRDSGLHVRWSLFGSCQVSADGKSWIVDDAWVKMHSSIKLESSVKGQ